MDNFLWVGDHPALDFLNTLPVVEGAQVDLLRSDAAVLRWLGEAGMLQESHVAKGAQEGLMGEARVLRETIRAAVFQRKAGGRVNLKPLNAFLREAGSYPQLAADSTGGLALTRRRSVETPRQLMSGLAESAAELLTAVDFDLVRKCEDAECVLWFLDRTKSHRRRWCSMAICGNRNKVRAFRERQQG